MAAARVLLLESPQKVLCRYCLISWYEVLSSGSHRVRVRVRVLFDKRTRSQPYSYLRLTCDKFYVWDIMYNVLDIPPYVTRIFADDICSSQPIHNHK